MYIYINNDFSSKFHLCKGKTGANLRLNCCCCLFSIHCIEASGNSNSEKSILWWIWRQGLTLISKSFKHAILYCYCHPYPWSTCKYISISELHNHFKPDLKSNQNQFPENRFKSNQNHFPQNRFSIKINFKSIFDFKSLQ